MSDFLTNAGTVFSVSAAAPATFDEAGYEALAFTDATAAEITDYQGPNPEWSVSTDNSYNIGGKADSKSSRSLGQGSITLQYKAANTDFWDIIDAANISNDAVLSVQVAKSDGVQLRFYTIQVLKAGEIQGSADDRETREIMMAFQTDVVKGTV